MLLSPSAPRTKGEATGELAEIQALDYSFLA